MTARTTTRTRTAAVAGVTSRTKAPPKGTPAYALWKAQRDAMNRSLSDAFDRHVTMPLKLKGWPQPDREWRFHPARQWRYDRAFPFARLVIDLDGGQWMRGGHSTGTGVERDREKDAEAVCAGLRVLRLTPAMVNDGRALEYVERALRAATHIAGAA